VRRGDLADLVLLALIWGASFLFIREALDDFSPIALVAIRLFLGTATLALVIAITRQRLEGWRSKWPALGVLGVSGALLPFLLISFGELHIPTGLTAILNATTPLFTAPIAHQWVGGLDRLTLPKVFGIGLGFIGVAVLLGVGTSGVTGDALVGGSAVLLASLSYAFASVWTRDRLQKSPPLLAPIGQTTFGFLYLAPFTLPALPDHLPSPTAAGSLFALGVLGTGLAYLLYFRLIRNVGATRATLVTYLLPCTAVLYGIVLLHERPGVNTFAGLALVLTGISFTLGLLPRSRRAAAVAGEE